MATKPTGGDKKQPAAAAPKGGADLLGAVVAQTQSAGAKDALKALVERAIGSSLGADKKKTVRNAIQLIEGQIKHLDSALAAQLNAILHTPAFQEIESTWRGLKYLVANTETGTMLKIRVLHATKKELLDDIENASDFDQSRVFKAIYEEEFGTYGGEPYGLLIGGYSFGRGNADLDLLMGMSNIASAAHAPFIAGASAHMFNLNSFEKLGDPRDLAKLFETNMEKWGQLRNMEDSRYIGLTLPRVLLRLPYDRDQNPVDGLDFQEDVDGTDNDKYL
jgi:type VI secretion system protein ImpC